MRRALPLLALLLPLATLSAQGRGKFPPDSLENVKVFPKDTPVRDVIDAMRGYTGALGVRCSYCHKGEEGRPLSEYDLASDDKRPKLVARQMMRMVQEINRRLDTIPERPADKVEVSCRTCHRGVSRPVPLASLMAEATTSAGVDSAVRAYRALRQRYYGSDAYDFGENALSSAAGQLARGGRVPDAMKLLDLNEEMFPGSAGVSLARGDVLLSRGDTAGAVSAYREALRRDPQNRPARGHLRELGQQP